MPMEGSVGWSTIYRALAHDDRRELFRYLGQVREARIKDVEHHLLDRASESAEEERDSIRIMLYHVHIPKLTEAGLLSWDRQEDRVTLTALGSQLPAEIISPSSVESPNTGDREPATE